MHRMVHVLFGCAFALLPLGGASAGGQVGQPLTLEEHGLGARSPYDLTDATVLAQQGSTTSENANARRTCDATYLHPATATVLATDLRSNWVNGPFGIALDHDNVYWTNQLEGTVKAVPITGGAVRVVANGQHDPEGIAVYGSNVYWVNFVSGSVMRASVTGGPVTELASAQQKPYAVAANAAGVFWTTHAGVMFLPASGGDPQPISPGLPAWGVTEHAGQFFWAQGTPETGPCDGLVYRSAAPYQARAKTRIAEAQCGPFGVAADNANVYWTDRSGKEVRTSKISGGAATTLATQENLTFIAVDDANVYWVDGLSVMRVPKGGGEPVAMVRFTERPAGIWVCAIAGIAVDDKSLYVVVDADRSGKIEKMAK